MYVNKHLKTKSNLIKYSPSFGLICLQNFTSEVQNLKKMKKKKVYLLPISISHS